MIAELKSLSHNGTARGDQELLRDARVRRLALESLALLEAIDAVTVSAAAADPDAQVRRLAVRAATIDGTDAVVERALNDPAAIVRIEALRTLRKRNSVDMCSATLAAASDRDANVALVAIDQLSGCGGDGDTVAYLSHSVDLTDAEAPRNWHRAAHSLVAVATAAPDRAVAALPLFAASRVWELRMYAARAAAIVKQRDLLERLARDTNDNVVEAALGGLTTTAGHEADEVYIAALSREGHQVIRAAAIALAHTPKTDAALGPLTKALAKTEEDGRPGATDARAALRTTLASIGSPVKAPKPRVLAAAPINAVDLKRLAAPRVRFTIRGRRRVRRGALHHGGAGDRASFCGGSPRRATTNGLTFHRVVPNGVIQGGSPGANEYSSDAPLMRDEVGLWPHVRGAIGISTRGRDTGDGQIFIDLVDHPRYDHTYNRVRAGPERHGHRRPHSRRRCHRDSRDPAVMFSGRIPRELESNRLSLAVARLRTEGRPILDLTESNPTRAGFSYPPDLLTPLAHARGLAYRPEPLGVPDGRSAVADDFARRGNM
jgi:cyclophilin family peptidyl-prolyl cis-trans isomerase